MARQGDNLSLNEHVLTLPLLDRRLSTGASLLKNIHGHDDNEWSHGDMHSTVLDGVFRYFIDKRWKSTRHKQTPPQATIRQLLSRDRANSPVNPVTSVNPLIRRAAA